MRRGRRHALASLAVALSLAVPTIAHAATDAESEDPYAFLGLEPLRQIPSFRVSGFDAVDDESVIVWGTRQNLYLFILNRRCMYLTTTEAIAISDTGAHIQTGFDDVTVLVDGIHIPCRISHIYRMRGREQMKSVKRQVREHHEAVRELERQKRNEDDS
jgi:hypothetical protein